jgi:hypothetical protein
VYRYHIFLIHSSLVGLLGYFHNLAIVNSGLQLSISCLHLPISWITGMYHHTQDSHTSTKADTDLKNISTNKSTQLGEKQHLFF